MWSVHSIVVPYRSVRWLLNYIYNTYYYTIYIIVHFPWELTATQKKNCCSHWNLTLHPTQTVEFIHRNFFDFNSLSKIDQSYSFFVDFAINKCELLKIYTISYAVHRSYNDLNNIFVQKKIRKKPTVDISVCNHDANPPDPSTKHPHIGFNTLPLGSITWTVMIHKNWCVSTSFSKRWCSHHPNTAITNYKTNKMI